jgi:hypothetical protein
VFHTGAFETLDREESEEVMLELINTLVRLDRAYLRRHSNTPRLYESGVRYQPETGVEELCTIPKIMQFGRSDCEDLAAWRVAELQERDHEAAAILMTGSDQSDGMGRAFKLYHLRVRRGNGQIEDPSEVLGMRRPVPNAWNPVAGVPLEVAREGVKWVRLYRQGSAGAVAYKEDLDERVAAGDEEALRILDFLRRCAAHEPTHPSED